MQKSTLMKAYNTIFLKTVYFLLKIEIFLSGVSI